MNKYIYVPYQDKDEAKKLGARWDKEANSWFIPAGVDEDLFRKWTEEKDPIEQFKAELIAHGCLLKTGEPICDGRKHRVKVVGDKDGCSGFYFMYLDGVPNAFFMNNRTKDRFKSIYVNRNFNNRISSEEVQKRREEFNRQHEIALIEEKKKQKEIASYISSLLRKLPSTYDYESPYFFNKRIPGSQFTFIEKQGEDLVTIIPLYDENVHLTTVQYIYPDGTKRFFKGGKKNGSSHVILGGIQDNDHTIIICEGYATAASIQYCLSNYAGVKVIAAIDAGNLLPVAEVFKKKYPNKNFIIACDNDHLSPKNTGVEEGEKTAKAINAQLVIPCFLQNEQGTDFNDLMLSHGVEFVVSHFIKNIIF